MGFFSQEVHTIEVHAIVKGKVQGVGFRATVRHFALQLGLVGTVCNLSDGSVEIYVKGSNKNIMALFQALHQEFDQHYISKIDQEQVSLKQPYEDFKIIY